MRTGQDKFFLEISELARNVEIMMIFFFFFVGIWSWLVDKLSFHPLVMKLDFYKPTVRKLHPPLCRITAHATVPGYFSTQY
jgi:hypothetical protein